MSAGHGAPLFRKRVAALAIGIGCVAGLAAAEVAVRIVEPPPDTPALPLPGSARLYGFQPNSTGLSGGVQFRTNSDGFRGPELTGIDGSRDLVIMVLGDSYAFGYGVEEGESFPALLELELSRAHAATQVRVVNLGIPGYDTSQELATLREWGPRLRPRIVLLQYHLNDLQRHPEAGSSTAPEPALAQVRRHVHLLRLVLPWLAALSRQVGLNPPTTATAEVAAYVNDEPAWQANRRALLDLFAAARELDAVPGVLVVPYLVDLSERHPAAPAYQVVVRFCDSVGVPVVNAFEQFRGERAGRFWISPFDGHPNAAGHVILARAALQLLGLTGRLEDR
jgi:lysophospholipase L1-like esterase